MLRPSDELVAFVVLSYKTFDNMVPLTFLLLVWASFQEVTSFGSLPDYPTTNHWCRLHTLLTNNLSDKSDANEKSKVNLNCKCTQTRFRCLDYSSNYRSKYPSKAIVIEPNGSKSWYMKCNIGSRDVSILHPLQNLFLDKVSTLNINDCHASSYQKVLSHLGIKSIDKLILRLQNAKTNLDGCSFGGIFRSYPMIKELELHSEGILSISSDAFSDLKTVTAIKIHRTSIKSLPESLLFPLKDLKRISIFWNHDLTGLPSKLFEKNIKLEQIMINNNQRVDHIDGNQFKGLQSLKELDLGSNNFKHIPENLFVSGNASDFSGLQRFTLLEDACGINCFRSIPQQLLKSLKNLKSFRYSTKYGIKLMANIGIFPPKFHLPSTLTTLQINRANLNENGLIDMLSSSDRAQKLDVSENEILHMKSTVIPSSVESVSLARNPFSCECETILNLKYLMEESRILEDGFLITLNCSKHERYEKTIKEMNSHQYVKYGVYHENYDYLTIQEADEMFCLNYEPVKEKVSMINLKSGTIFSANTINMAIILASLCAIGLITGVIFHYKGSIISNIKQCWRKCNITNSPKNVYEEY